MGKYHDTIKKMHDAGASTFNYHQYKRIEKAHAEGATHGKSHHKSVMRHTNKEYKMRRMAQKYGSK